MNARGISLGFEGKLAMPANMHSLADQATAFRCTHLDERDAGALGD
jgi:hypothetical protein